MSSRELVAVWEPKQGYNTIAKEYKSYHAHLDSFERGQFLRFLPRKKTWQDTTPWFRILDVGAGDGRSYKYFTHVPIVSYTACDIAQDLLARHPKGQKVQTVVCDLEEVWPFADDAFDLMTSFFVIEHLSDLDHFFSETARVLEIGGRCILGYLLQRRSVVFRDGRQKFSIDRTCWRKDDIIAAAENQFLTIAQEEVREKKIHLGRIFVIDKK